MESFLPYMTNDFSVGLYSEDTDDIYHSAHGAVNEAYEKFIKPLNLKNILAKKDELKVLDICFGIGYNTKVLINEFKRFKNKRIDIDCVDTNFQLMKLSPFISTRINFIDRVLKQKELYKNINSYDEAKKIIELKKKRVRSHYKISQEVNYTILKELYKGEKIQIDNETKKIITDNQNFLFFDKGILKIVEFLEKKEDKYYQSNILNACLHNIYYKNITKRYINKYADIVNLNFFAQDIRDFVKNTSSIYDIVLLDGFTPLKCPCIWSQDFFEKLYSLMRQDAILVTYNSSAVTRSALLNTGFFIGNTFDKKRNVVGTIASKDDSLIKNKLTKKQLGLLGTRAGVPFRDANLDLDNYAIINNRKFEVENSTLESSSRYLKRCKNEI